MGRSERKPRIPHFPLFRKVGKGRGYKAHFVDRGNPDHMGGKLGTVSFFSKNPPPIETY